MKIGVISFYLIFLISISANSAIIRVPYQYGDIQTAINHAQSGDSIVVSDGTYIGDANRDLEFDGKAVVLMSENGPDRCIIDCERTGRAFYFHHAETIQTVVRGFSIRNGLVSNSGGAIYCQNASPWIDQCIISGNTADHGGGIRCYYSSPTITRCVITNNYATNYGGGGIFCYSSQTSVSAPHIEDSTISHNYSTGFGGGICCYADSAPVLINNTISENTAVLDGAGIYANNSQPQIDRCSILHNMTISGNGAGYFCSNTSSPMTNSSLTGNIAQEGSGAGFYCIHSSLLIANCLFSANTSNNDMGGGFSCTNGSQPTLLHCTFSGNFSTIGGGAIACFDSTPTIHNSILWNNGSEEIAISNGNPQIQYSDVAGGWEGLGNISLDPRFVSTETGAFYLSQIASGQESDSPCVNTGSCLASLSCFNIPSGELCMDLLTTRTDGGADTGQADMGYHDASNLPTPEPTASPISTATHPPETPTPSPSGSQTATHPPTTEPTASPTQSPTRTPTGNPSTTQTPSPSQTPSPPVATESPTAPCSAWRAQITMPSDRFSPGDPCWCNISICNPENTEYRGVPVFAVLDVYGSLFFAPSFTSFDYFSVNIPSGTMELAVLPLFYWPSHAGTAENILWYAGITDRTMTELWCQSVFRFGWYESFP